LQNSVETIHSSKAPIPLKEIQSKQVQENLKEKVKK